ncbi:MAG: shikimate dehydrogenase [Hyphomicrobiales bacterium]|nr:shikimate dehydrogenase [Hyphomicrobiales bacterium]
MSDISISGETHLNFIIGDPIVQVKSPSGLTQAFAAKGLKTVVLPVQIGTDKLSPFLESVTPVGNLDGIIVTLPHKLACVAHCTTISDRARHLQAVNVMRRNLDGSWHGDMLDGVGFVEAARRTGFEPVGQRALVVGAGGAGSAIALALLEAGARAISVHDSEPGKREALIGKLRRISPNIEVGSNDATGFDAVVNATPAGMKGFVADAVDLRSLSPHSFVGCAVTDPAVTPLIAQARKIGCTTITGIEMYAALESRMLEFFLEGLAPPHYHKVVTATK